MAVERTDWKRFRRRGFGLEFSYPAVTPRGRTVERDEEPLRENARVHLSSADRQELYLEVVHFRALAPEDEFLHHSPYLVKRFGAESVSALIETSLHGRRAWTYAFRWQERDRSVERAVFLLPVGRDTYRIIYDPRSGLNTDIIATLTIAS